MRIPVLDGDGHPGWPNPMHLPAGEHGLGRTELDLGVLEPLVGWRRSSLSQAS
jgi:hypothetical protein